MIIDFDSFFRNRIENLLIRASWMGDLRKTVGLEGFSQVWTGNAQWYFWLHGAPGAYRLTFSEGDTVRYGPKNFYEGRFVLKCYPSPIDPGYAGYSAEERLLLSGERFDVTGTPRFEAVGEIPEALFTVGVVSMVIDPQGGPALLTFDSLEAFTTYDGRDPASGLRPTSPRVIRNVCGWRHGRPLFDCLVGLYANFHGHPPSFMGAAQSQGFENWILPSQSTECRSSDTIRRLALSIGFEGSKKRADDLVERLWRSRLEAGEEVLVSCKLPAASGPGNFGVPAPFTPSPSWWEAARPDFQSDLSSTCGCDDHRCLHRAIPAS
jgi:hypothetical protein